jgi:hypothetical protein
MSGTAFYLLVWLSGHNPAFTTPVAYPSIQACESAAAAQIATTRHRYPSGRVIWECVRR